MRDKQLKELEKQNRALVTDVETQRKDLERIILELQNELYVCMCNTYRYMLFVVSIII